MKKKLFSSSRGGQMTIEAVLIMVVLMGVVLAFQKRATANSYASAFTEGPWLPIQGMIEDGVWTKNPTSGMAMHPSLLYRHHTTLTNDTPSADTGD
jgi:hypothetical protein